MIKSKNKTKTKIKGSVLFTVVSVMSILVVFSCAALIMAASANRRAHNRYADIQTRLTAKSVVDCMMSVLEENGEKAVGNLDLEELNRSLGDSSMGKVIAAAIEKMGTIADLESKGSNFETSLSSAEKANACVYKLSATVSMLGQENTVALYCYEKEITPPPDGNFNYALVSLDNAKMDNVTAYGGVGVGLGLGTIGDSRFQNNGCKYTPINSNGNLIIDQPNNIKLTQGKGMYVNGKLTLDHDATIESIINQPTGIDYKQLPYIFAEDSIDYGNNLVTIGSYDSPVIIMTKETMGNAQNVHPIYGDLFLYNNTLFNTKSVELHSFNPNVLDNGYTGGNIYSLGETKFKSGASNNMTPAHNIITNILNIDMNDNSIFSIGGAAVANEITISNISNKQKNYEFPNGLFVDPENLVDPNNPTTFKDNCINEDNICINNVKFGKREHLVDCEPKMVSAGSSSITQPVNEPWYVSAEKTELLTNESSWEDSWYSSNEEFKYTRSNQIHQYTIDYTDNFPDKEGMLVRLDSVRINIDGISDTNKVLNDIKARTRILNKNTNYIYNSYKLWYNKEWNGDVYLNSGIGLYLNNVEDPAIQFEINYGDFDNIPESDFNINVSSIKIDVSFYETVTKEIQEYDVNETPITYLKAVNDVAFDNNGGMIEISNPFKTIVLTKNEDGSYSVDGTPYADYGEFLKAVVDTVTFPESMQKDNVIKSKSTDGFVDDSFLDKNTDENGVTKTIIKSKAEQKVESAFAHIKETEETVYDGVYPDEPITKSCTFSGELKKCITIAPEEDNIYIKLDNFSVQDSGDLQNATVITVDDSNGTKRVNFLIPDGSYAKIIGNVLTTYYSNSGIIDISHNPSEQKMVPGIYFYVKGEYTVDAYGNESNYLSFKFSHISAYIIAPHGKIIFLDDHVNNKKYLKHEYNKDSEEWKNGLYGAIITKEISFMNIRNFYYINPDQFNSPPPDDSDKNYNYNFLYYQEL